MTIGPSMANIVQFYGHRRLRAVGQPQSAEPQPVVRAAGQPGSALRDNEIQYVVWDSFSAGRSPNFSDRLLRYADATTAAPCTASCSRRSDRRTA